MPHLKIVDCVWNVMAHAQKPDFVFRRNGRVHLNRRGGGGASVQLTGSRGVRISGSNAGYNMFRGSVKSTGYPLHSPVSPSLPLPCVTVCHHISTGLYSSHTKTLYHFVHTGHYTSMKQETTFTGFEEAVVVLNLKTSIKLDGLQEEVCTMKPTLALYLNDKSKRTISVNHKWYQIVLVADS